MDFGETVQTVIAGLMILALWRWKKEIWSTLIRCYILFPCKIGRHKWVDDGIVYRAGEVDLANMDKNPQPQEKCVRCGISRPLSQ